MRDSFVKAIEYLAASNKDVLLITADLGFSIFDNFKKKFPKQFIITVKKKFIPTNHMWN